MASANLSLKLTVYTKGNKVLFAEAGKNVVDFLFSIFSLSVGTVIRLLKKQEMVGALGNLCQSIEDLNDIYMQPDQTKDTLLMPRIATPAAEVPLLLLNVESTEKALYRCSVNRQIGCGSYVSDDPSVACGQCGSRMNTPATYLKNPNKVASSTEGGFVKGAVAYMIMDDLVVKPMSTMSIVTIVSKFNVKDVSALEEKEVTLSMDEGLKLLKASLSTKNVLTDVFLACHNNESGSSVFGEKPAFGGFGSATQTTPFGSTTQQSQPAFGSSVFGSSSPFGASSQAAFGATSTLAFGAAGTPAFGATSTPAFGTSSIPAFCATSTPAFGATSTPAFGATSTPAFGVTSTSAFGSTVSAFGVSNSPTLGSGGAFGASSSPAFGSSGTPAFGASRTPAFGASSTPAFGASSTPSFSFGSSPAFGQSASAFGSSPFGTATAPFGAQSSPFGTQATSSALGSSTFVESAGGTPPVGSRVAPYTPTTETEAAWPPAGDLESISAMPVYEDKSHEELRWEDYHVGDKGGLLPASQPAAGVGFGAPA